MRKAGIKDLDFEKGGGLIPAIVQEYKTRKVLMLAYMDREALEKTLETGLAHYYSRSRQRLWMKGESSGNIQRVRRIYVDCDGDAILLQVEQVGDACHLGEHSCFHRTLEEAESLHQSFDRWVAERIREDYSTAEVTTRRWVKDKRRKEYRFIITPYTEHYTPPDPEVYEWIAEKIDEATPDVDKVVVPECLGIPIAQLVASRKGRPLAIVRKRPLKPGDKGIDYASGYEKGKYYIYGVSKGERVLLIDDTISTGGTIIALTRELANRGIEVSAIAAIASKEDYKGRELIEKLTALRVQSIVKVYIKDGRVEVEVE